MVSSYLVVVSAASQVLLLVVVLTSRKAAARCGTPRVCEACRDGEALGDLHEGQEMECKIAVPKKYQRINLKKFHHLSFFYSPVGEKNCSVGDESLPLSPCLPVRGRVGSDDDDGGRLAGGQSVGQSKICREDTDNLIDLITPTFGDVVILSGRK